MTNKTLEGLQVNTPSATKKQWVSPKADVISNDTIKVGTTYGGAEGQHTSGNVVFYHS